MARIFISYNRASLPEVEGLAEDLRDLWDHEVWFDQALTGGQRWWDNILAQIRKADIFVFALTPESLDSEACRQELLYANRLSRPILPIRFSDDVDPNLLSSPLNEIQCFDCRVRDRTALANLRRAIAGLAAAPPLPEPLPEPPPVPLSYLGNLRERIDTAQTLSYPDQAGLVLDIKGYLKGRGANARSEVEQLLRRLRQRPDLLAIVSGEIDEVLATLERPQPRTQAKSDAADTRQAGPDDRGRHATGAAEEPATDAAGVAAQVEHPPSEREARRPGTPPAPMPPAVFALGEAREALNSALSRLVARRESWKLSIDEQNFIVLSTVAETGKPAELHALITVRDNVKDEKEGALKSLGWEIGGAQAAKGIGAAALIYATSGLGAVGLFSKTVRDYLLSYSARKVWPDAERPETAIAAALELTATLRKIAEAGAGDDTIVRLERL